ncbi:MAG: hypothetical protein BM557_08580 [Flavobacterium sp. MedPE-SWcel]|nr:MAG: hypothetical protein BM557_08580 [Flavobacterium sp. MedPE-SWcel]
MDKMYNFKFGQVYHLKTDNEYLADELIVNNDIFDSKETIIINSLSKNGKVYLLPTYRDKNKKQLKKAGLHPKTGACKIDFLKFIIDQEIDNYKFIIFGFAALSFDGVDFLKEYLHSKIKGKEKIGVLVDYQPNCTKPCLIIKPKIRDVGSS